MRRPKRYSRRSGVPKTAGSSFRQGTMTMSTKAFLFIVLPVGGALLALWAIARFPRYGPSTISGAMAHLLIAVATGWLIPVLVPTAASAWGIVPAVVGVVLPSLVYVFWAAGCLIRVLQETLTRGSVR